MSNELLGILFYIILQALVGVWFMRKIKTEKDYFLAGKSLGLPLASFSIFATWFGAETCLGSSGIIFSEGLSGSAADPFGYTLCLLLMGLFFASRLWKKNLTTLGDLYRLRFSTSVEKVAVIIMIPTSLFWAAAQVRALGQVLSASSEMNVKLAMTVATGIVILYTVVGGLMADVINDVVHGVALTLGLVVLFGVLLYQVGGVSEAIQAVDHAKLSFIPPEGTLLGRIEAWSIPVFGSLVAQELVARVIATKNPEVAKRATLVGASGYLLVGLIPVCIALFAHVFVGESIENPEQLLPMLAKQHLHTFLYVIFAGALVAAILSTVDSTLLAVSSLFSHNLVFPLMKKPTEAKKVRIARGTVIVAGLLAYGMALFSDGIYELVETASSFGSSGIFVITVFALFTRFGSTISAISTLVVGTLSMMVAETVFEFEAPYVFSIFASFTTFISIELFVRMSSQWGKLRKFTSAS